MSLVQLNSLQVPSGRTLDSDDLALLVDAHTCGSIVYRDKPFRLKSGIESNVYVFLRGDLTDAPSLLYKAGKKIAHTVWDNCGPDDHQPSLIGLPTAGTALAVAASVYSWGQYLSAGRPVLGERMISCRVMREQLKQGHGANERWVNGEVGRSPDLDRFTFWTVDNVTTDGETKIEMAKRLVEDGYPAKEMPQLIFVDRQQGGVARLEAAGFKRVVICYNLLDITYAFGELELWPKEAVRQVEMEIAAHQFK